MNPSDQTSGAIPLPDVPYVGMRPFEEADRRIFFGRDRDATLLANKVFSARLTVLYGPSGIGKSSILRTLLVPNLEKEEARVICFDDWRADDPTATLKDRLVAEAKKLQIPEPEAGAPSLADLVRLLLSADDRTVVLILDQFEEFFTHGHILDPFRKDLGTLVRTPDLDVRVLLSLREEHLASLEPFRSEILNLFQSTYRLEPLDDNAIREAIEGPANLFEATYEPEFVARLIDDLRQQRPQTESGPRSPEDAAVDLPMLQLLCAELWKRGDKKTISLNLYQQLGGQKGILETYLKEVMPHRWREKDLAARLMEYLAPSDGYKMSFSASFLASRTDLPEARVQTELERLSAPEVRVLRSSKYGTGDVRYELWHDSFIRIIAPWRDGILRRAKLWRWSTGILAGLIFLTGVAFLVDWWNIQKNTERTMRDENLSAEQKFDHVAQYLLWSRSDFYPFDIISNRFYRSNRFDRLRDFLKNNVQKLPRWYGIEHSGIEYLTEPRGEWPLTIHYSSARQLDQRAFTQTWQKFAITSNRKNIPVPLKLRFVVEDTYPKELIRLTGPNIQDLEDKIPAYEEEYALISAMNLSKPGWEFLERYSEWKEVPQLKKNGPWWVVPRWSLPAWKVYLGDIAIDGSGIPAVLLAVKLREEYPDRLVNADAMDILLSGVAESNPQTVAEARTVRGDRFLQDFQEILKQRFRLTGLPILLNTLANYPEGSPAEIASKVIADLSSAQISLPSPQLRGPHPEGISRPQPLPQPQAVIKRLHQSYRAAAEWLPDKETEVRIYLGYNLMKAWTEADTAGKLDERLNKFQDTIMRRFGISISDPSWDWWIDADAFRIEILNQNEEDCLAQPIYVGKDDPLERLSAALESRIESYRIHFLTAETVNTALKTTQPALRSWLEARYSLTDLKLLLRALVNPSKEELDARQSAFAAGTLDQPNKVPPENSIRQPAWLLASLVFWSQVEDPRSFSAMADDLRRTQRARIDRKPISDQNPEIARLIATGVESLGQGRIGDAEAAFAGAIKSDKEAAITSFLVLYPQELRQSILRKFTDPRIDLRNLTATRAERIELEDLEKDFDEKTDVQTARRLRLCLLRISPYRQARHGLVTKIVDQHGNPEDWPAAEAAWFGTRLLTSFDPLTGDKSIPQTGLAFLQKALPQLSSEDALKAYGPVMAICLNPGPNQWCWDLLPALAEVRKDPDIKLGIAEALAGREVAADIQRALRLTNQAKQELPGQTLSKEKREQLADQLDFVRAYALLRLTQLGGGGDEAEAESILRRLVNSPTLRSQAYARLALLLRRQNRLEEATAILESGMKKSPEAHELYEEKLFTTLAAGDRDGVSQLALESLKKVKRDKNRITGDTQGFAFVAAWGLLVTQSDAGEWAAREVLPIDHPYVPYVEMMLFSRLMGKDKVEAREMMERRWGRVKPESWGARMRQGDETVWTEMLIGYYLGKVQRQQIFGDLEDEQRFAASDLSHIPRSRRGMLCEAYFYDALLAEAKGDKGRRRISLEKTLQTNYRDYPEYMMAQFLLKQKIDQ